jgi:hypothetical protein
MAAFSQQTFKHIGDGVLAQAFADTSTTQLLPLGSRARGYNATDGVAEFIYLVGVADTLMGSWVTYLPDSWGTKILTANDIGPVAIAMSANVASQYGWYMIHGKVDAKAKDVADNGKVYIDTTPGSCDDAVVAGDKVFNATWASADDTGVASVGWAEVEIAYPFTTDEST